MNTTVKPHKRHSKKGLVYFVKGYARAKAGSKTLSSVSNKVDNLPGDEFKRLASVDKSVVLAWEAKHGYKRPAVESAKDYADRIGKLKQERYENETYGYKSKPSPKSTPIAVKKSKQDVFSRAEDRMASFVSRYGNKKYKRTL